MQSKTNPKLLEAPGGKRREFDSFTLNLKLQLKLGWKIGGEEIYEIEIKVW